MASDGEGSVQFDSEGEIVISFGKRVESPGPLPEPPSQELATSDPHCLPFASSTPPQRPQEVQTRETSTPAEAPEAEKDKEEWYESPNAQYYSEGLSEEEAKKLPLKERCERKRRKEREVERQKPHMSKLPPWDSSPLRPRERDRVFIHPLAAALNDLRARSSSSTHRPRPLRNSRARSSQNASRLSNREISFREDSRSRIREGRRQCHADPCSNGGPFSTPGPGAIPAELEDEASPSLKDEVQQWLQCEMGNGRVSVSVQTAGTNFHSCISKAPDAEKKPDSSAEPKDSVFQRLFETALSKQSKPWKEPEPEGCTFAPQIRTEITVPRHGTVWIDLYEKGVSSIRDHKVKCAAEQLRKEKEELRELQVGRRIADSLYRSSTCQLKRKDISVAAQAEKPLERVHSQRRMERVSRRLSRQHRDICVGRELVPTEELEARKCTFKPEISKMGKAHRIEGPMCDHLYKQFKRMSRRKEEIRDQLIEIRKKEILEAKMEADHHFRRQVDADPTLKEKFMNGLVV